jgi:hypothetical protein
LRLLSTLIENENKEVLEALLELVKENSFNLLVILKNRVSACVDRLLDLGKQKPLSEKVYDIPSVVPEPQLISQPFYLPDGFTFEVKL